MPNIGPAELMIVLAIALIVFGPKKLPEIGKGIGNALREFNRARNDFMETLHSETDRDDGVRASPHSVSSSSSYDGADYSERSLEYPDPVAPDEADALPYGGDFYAAEGDSQPSFRTTSPEDTPDLSTAKPTAQLGDGKV